MGSAYGLHRALTQRGSAFVSVAAGHVDAPQRTLVVSDWGLGRRQVQPVGVLYTWTRLGYRCQDRGHRMLRRVAAIVNVPNRWDVSICRDRHAHQCCGSTKVGKEASRGLAGMPRHAWLVSLASKAAAVSRQKSLFVHQVDSMEMLDSTSLYGFNSPKIVRKELLGGSCLPFGMFLKEKSLCRRTQCRAPEWVRQVWMRCLPSVWCQESHVLILPVFIESASFDTSSVLARSVHADGQRISRASFSMPRALGQALQPRQQDLRVCICLRCTP